MSFWSWWWTGKPGVLQSVGLQRVRHDWATELNWPNCPSTICWFLLFTLKTVRVMLQFSSVTQSCPTLCDPTDCSTPGFPVYYQLLELAQTHVHWVSDAIQPSHPLLRALGNITSKASGGDGIPAELFQILKDDAVKVLHSICQHIWKTQQWPQDWKNSVFFPIPKKGNAKEYSNYCTIALISHASKVMLKTSRCSSWI